MIHTVIHYMHGNSCSGKRPGKLGLCNGLLAPCPKSSNCVSSQTKNEKHRIEPLRYAGSRKTARDLLLQLIRSMKRAELIKEEENYIHVEFRYALWHLVDDVEFYFYDNSTIIHVRSASSLGYYDMGVNRRRIERIRKEFNRLQGNQ